MDTLISDTFKFAGAIDDTAQEQIDGTLFDATAQDFPQPIDEMGRVNLWNLVDSVCVEHTNDAIISWERDDTSPGPIDASERVVTAEDLA